MFGPSYFGATYFGPRFFPPGLLEVVDQIGGGTRRPGRGFQPILSGDDLTAKRERDRKRRLALGRVIRTVKKGGVDAVDFDSIIERMEELTAEGKASERIAPELGRPSVQEPFLNSPQDTLDQSQALDDLRAKLRSRRLRILLLTSV